MRHIGRRIQGSGASMSRTKLTPKQQERQLADMLNAAHHYNLKSGVGAPFSQILYDGDTVVSVGECCAIGAAALIDCPLPMAAKQPYQCAALHFGGPDAVLPIANSEDLPYVVPDTRDGNSAMFHGNDEWPNENRYYSDGPNSDMWELGYMFREAMQPADPPISGCSG